MARHEQTVCGEDLPLGYQQISNLVAAVGLTVPNGAKRALFRQAEQIKA